MSEVVLRLAVEGDAATIAALFSRARDSLSFLPRLHSADEDLAFWRQHVLPQMSVMVAVEGADIVGVLAEDGVFVHHLYVDPEHAGRGVGTRLILDAQGRREALQLWCFTQNMGACRFYERHGFVVVETTDGAGNEEKCPDVRYQWKRMS